MPPPLEPTGALLRLGGPVRRPAWQGALISSGRRPEHPRGGRGLLQPRGRAEGDLAAGEMNFSLSCSLL